MATNKEIADAFRAAVPHLWDGVDCYRVKGSQYICYCVGHAREAGEIGEPAARGALALIGDRLRDEDGEKYATLRTWLLCVAKVPAGDLSDVNVQRHRRAWMHKLIEELDPQPVEA